MALQWSSKLDRLYLDCIHSPIMSHPKTFVDEEDSLRPLGIPFQTVRQSIIQYGRADFSTNYQAPQIGKVSSRTKVLLYCFMNMRRHFWSNYATFHDHRPILTPPIDQPPVILVDVGCGPGTGGLAFAELFGSKPFSYIGIDRAKPMRLKCRELLQAGKSMSLIRQESHLRTMSTWENLPGKFPNAAVIFNFAFFFASKTLTLTDVRSLAKRIQEIQSHSSKSRIFISYTNSTYAKFSERYFRFLQYLGFQRTFDVLRSELETHTVVFRPKRNGNPPITETYVRSFFELV